MLDACDWPVDIVHFVGAVRCAVEVQNGLIERNSLRREARETRAYFSGLCW
jgi:hypothetical protein